MDIQEIKLRHGEHKDRKHNTTQTGLRLPPPPGRRIHAPHNIYRGGGVGALEAPQDR